MTASELRAAAKQLGKIIDQLERWQARYPGLDGIGSVAGAKSNLMRHLRLLEEDASLRDRK